MNATRCAAAALVGALAVLGASGCDRQGSETAAVPHEPEAAEPAPAPAEPARFAGSAACAECHADQAARWRNSHHARSMQKAGPDTVLGHFAGASFRDGPVTWKFERGEALRVRSEGAEKGSYEVAYTIGVDPLQQLVVPFADGRLQPLHVAWDARPAKAGGQRWFSIDPERVKEGDFAHWKSPLTSWNSVCADCHTTGFRKGYDLAANRFDSSWAELGVGCEACHGAGSRHVEWARAGAKDGGSRGLDVQFAPAAKPGAGAKPSREVDACAACHSERARIVDPPRAGSALLDDYEPALLDRTLYHDDGQVAGVTYQWGSFVQTSKYAAGVRCSDCHEPHSGQLRAEGNALCATCHEPARFDAPAHHHHTASPTPTCVDCHMTESVFPSIGAAHDHGFHVPRPDLSLEIGTPNACSTCHAKRGDEWAAAAVKSWRGDAAPRAHFGQRLHARQLGGNVAGSTLASLFADASAPAIVRATALLELAGDPRRDQIDKAARAPDPVLRLAAARGAGNLSSRERVIGIANLLEDPLRTVRIEAANALADVPVDQLSATQRDARTRALEEYRGALALALDSPVSHANLGVLHQQQGDAAAAEAAFQTALRLADTFVPAYTGLSNLYASQDRDGDGAMLLHRGIERVPDSPDLHFTLAMLLVRQEQGQPALEEFAKAVQLGPENPYFAYVYAVALSDDGRTAKALTVLRKALELHPLDQNLLGAMAITARNAKRYDEALAAARKLEELFPGQSETDALVKDLQSLSEGGPGVAPALEPATEAGTEMPQ
jgi:predicted CXXCH cytochrome family protein